MQSRNSPENPNPHDEKFISIETQEIQENEANLTDNEEEEEEEDDDLGFEFSFMVDEANPSSPISAEEAFVNGQIKPILNFNGQDLAMMKLPTKPPVKNVFVEVPSDEGRTAAKEEGDDVYAVTSSPSPSCKKSNSTGFSRIWRFSRGFAMGRSNSDGRDAFVFLSEGHAPPKASEESKMAAVRGKGKKKEESSTKPAAVNGTGKGKKVNNPPSMSACEAYMRSKADERRKPAATYLPYRPGLMGFFTNVSGGMSKNVHHPF